MYIWYWYFGMLSQEKSRFADPERIPQLKRFL
jgi:hypothetical protein